MAAITTAVIGAAVAVTTTAVSFANMAAQKKKQQKAESAADKAMNEARGKLDVNFAEAMTIKKEAYDNEREALLVQGAMATQAGVESERGSAATAGRTYAAQVAGQAQVRGAMADELTNIENAKIEEDSRLRDLDVALDLEEVAGNQLQAANAQAAAEKSMQEGITGAINVAGQVASFAPLYAQNVSSQRAAAGGMQTQYSSASSMPTDNSLSKGLGAPVSLGQNAGNSNWGGVGTPEQVFSPVQGMQPMTVAKQTPMAIGIDYSIFKDMNNAQMRQWKRQNPNLWNKMKTSPEYISEYNKI